MPCAQGCAVVKNDLHPMKDIVDYAFFLSFVASSTKMWYESKSIQNQEFRVGCENVINKLSKKIRSETKKNVSFSISFRTN